MKKQFLSIALLVFLVGFSQTNKQIIQSYLNNNFAKQGLTSRDVSEWRIQSEAVSEASNVTSCYVVQRHKGIEIFNAQSTISIKDSKVVYAVNRFKKNISQKINSTTPSLSVIDAIQKAYSKLGITNNSMSFSVGKIINDKSFKLINSIQKDSISGKLVYQVTKDENLKLAWAFQFYSPDEKHLWDIRIDAQDGSVLEKNDLMISCDFGYTNHTETTSTNHFIPKTGFSLNSNSSILKTDASSYKVIPFNYESPNHTSFQLITSPSVSNASPKGWHDSNSLDTNDTTNKYTDTRGNNVWAQEDAYGDGGDPIFRPDGGAALNFNFTYGGQSSQPINYRGAATTNLFYMTNILHDVWYQYGFDEASGNFQKSNYGRGGAQGDYVLADSQDGYLKTSPTLNNANFATPSDGFKPRVQMYLWTSGTPPVEYLTINSPAEIVGPKIATTNIFEGTDRIAVPAAPNGIVSDIILYKNNPTPPGYNSGCQAPTNAAALAGKIALLKRGGCSFNLKVKNAQIAGAIAVVVMDSVANNPTRVSMSSTGILGITIPAVFISKEIGDAIIAKLEVGPVNIKLETPSNMYLYADGDFDNGIISHEYAHGISNRLTGGRLEASCLTSPEQMGEGWSDWTALMMQLKSGDSGNSPRGIGTYSVNQSVTGGGIRSYRYSTNMTDNPLTFGNTNGKTYVDYADNIEKVSPHATGEIWATMLWDLTWAYIAKYGFNPDIYTGTGGNNKVMRIVLDAMKLQPCNPSYVEARNAIIAADQAITGGQDYCLIWKVFARRGLGVNASSGDNSGDRTNIAAINDQVQDFTEPAAGANCSSLGINPFINGDAIKIFPNPVTKGQINISIREFTGKIKIQIVDLAGRLVYSKIDTDFNGQKTINLSAIQKGIYIIKVSNEIINHTEKIIVK